jgi:TfoX/Sxy family transcriptional regulator of competence genes
MAKLKKSSPELIALFDAAVPADKDIVKKQMFGYPAAFINGNMICGLFEEEIIVRLGEDGAAAAVAKKIGFRFSPMPGREMKAYIALAPAIKNDPKKLKAMLIEALEFTLTLKPKEKKPAKKKAVGKK